MILNESELYPYTVTDLSSKDALILAPHPDDESIGCGGSIVKHIKAGSRVRVIFLTDGDKGDFEGKFGKRYGELRRESCRRAMEILGVQDYEFWGYGDRELYRTEGEVTERLIQTIDTFSPSLVYVPSPFEAHPDHRASFAAALRSREKREVPLMAYEVLMALYPNVLVDITNEMERKREAIGSYFTEIEYNDYLPKVEGLNRCRTGTLSREVRYAEAFVLVGIEGLSGSLSERLLLNAYSTSGG